MIVEYKGYQIKPHAQFPSSYIVVTAGKGGKIPDILQSFYTSVGIAQVAISKYVDSKTPKEEQDADQRKTVLKDRV